jgi:type II secretory pathway component GspD/PulD (secretin)
MTHKVGQPANAVNTRCRKPLVEIRQQAHPWKHPKPLIIADPRTNTLILSIDTSQATAFHNLIEKLDGPTPAPATTHAPATAAN